MQLNNKVLDRYDRPLKDLRISVTDRCNFRCGYCMPEEIFGPDYPFMKENSILSFAEITRLVNVFAELGVDKIRLTGGEPLLRKNLSLLVSEICQVPGITDIALTTNGSLLAKQAGDLKSAGLHRVSVSLDSLNDERFGRMNGKGFPVAKVLEGIEAAAEVGLAVKVNMVVQRGINDLDILPMARFFKNKKIQLRFIEFMDVGNSNGWKLDSVVPSRDIIQMIQQELPLVPAKKQRFGEVAERYYYEDCLTEVGFISSVTQAFCSTCTRARMSADGKLYTCLFSGSGMDLREPLRNSKTDMEISQLIQSTWRTREDRYSEVRSQHTPDFKKVEMSHIGG